MSGSSSSKHKTLSILHGEKGAGTRQPMTSLDSAVHHVLISPQLADRTALRHGDESVSFAQLRSKVKALVRKLGRPGEEVEDVGDGDDEQTKSPAVVALLLPPSTARIAAMLACFVTGNAYLPLDAHLPKSRIEYMFGETKPRLLLCWENSSIPEDIKAVCEELSVKLVYCNDLPEDADDATFPKAELGTENPNSVACVLYTSGSTGTPKGVRLQADNIMNRLEWYWRVFPFSKEEVGSHKTSLLFVDSMTEILCCLLKGVPLQIFDNATVANVELFIRELHKYRVSRLVLVPSLMKAMIDVAEMTNTQELLSTLTSVVSSGEALSADLATKFFNVSPSGVNLLNFYGSTETTGDVAYTVLRNPSDVAKKQFNGIIALGKPVDRNKVYILDDELKVLPQGMTGEVVVSGLNVADGYVKKRTHAPSEEGPLPNAPAGSNFIPNIFCNDKAHAVLYRMGDLGRIINGELYYEGRKDSQVKIRGKRVNLLEVENVIKKVPCIVSVVVLCATLSSNEEATVAPWSYEDKVPVAFLKIKQSVDKPQAEQRILETCAKDLPDYMMPQVEILDDFPLQEQTRKVDRQQLLRDFMNKRSCGAPSNPWGTITQHLGVTDDQALDGRKSFTELGGTSLGAVSTVVALHKAGYGISLDTFLSAKNIDAILDLLSSEEGKLTSSGSATPDQATTVKYKPELLHLCTDHADALELLAVGFAKKNPLDVLAESTGEYLRKTFGSIWDAVLKDEVSFVIRDPVSKKIIAAGININARTQIEPHFEKEEVMEINEAVEGPIRQEVLDKGGEWIDAFIMSVDDDIPQHETIHLVQLLEEAVYKIGQEKGFDGVITVNSHPVTAMVAEQLGYVIRKSVHVKSFEFQGRQPFQHAPDDFYIHCMTRHISKQE